MPTTTVLSRVVVPAFALALALAACGDDGPAVVDAGRRSVDLGDTDAGRDLCPGMPDGSVCGEHRVCVAGACTISMCGDGVVDWRATEECDDGNSITRDGCETGCTFTCIDDTSCNDAIACNGEETCTVSTHTCTVATRAADGTSCSDRRTTPGVCRDGTCVSASCGNGVVDPGEDCDDSNVVANDRCEIDCSFSCMADVECDDGDACNGPERCDTLRCISGVPGIRCTMSDACHTPTTCGTVPPGEARCFSLLLDADGDGEASTALGACGTDCDDTDALVNSAASERAENGLDDDCDASTPDSATTTYYVDCDADGFAGDEIGAVSAIEMPTTRPCPMDSGVWTLRRPLGELNTDCDDFNAVVRPSQASFFTAPYAPSDGGAPSFNYNCIMATNDVEFPVLGFDLPCELADSFCLSPPCTSTRSEFICSGTSGWSGTDVPECGVSAPNSTCARTPTVCRWDGLFQLGCQPACNSFAADCCPLDSSACHVADTPGTYCTPGTLGCAFTCTPNTPGCAWRFLGCADSVAPRTQACR